MFLVMVKTKNLIPHLLTGLVGLLFKYSFLWPIQNFNRVQIE